MDTRTIGKAMNHTLLHLVIGHLPVFGSFMGAVVMTYGLLAGSSSTKRSAYILFILSAIGAVLAYLSGAGAKDTVKMLADTGRNTIGIHRDFAAFALAAAAALGILSAAGLIIRFKSRSPSHTLAGITLFISLITLALAAWTGYLGLQIRHTETEAPASDIRNPAETP